MPYVRVVLMLSEWVDFTFEGFTYNMTGSTSMQLSDLMDKLGVEGFDVSKVENVEFTDESLLKLEKNEGGDYTLTSLQPFGTNELLTVEMNDGVVYKIGVKDAQSVDLGRYLTGFTASTKDQNGKWVPTTTVTDGNDVAFDINFTVPSGALTADQKVLTFDVSEGGQITLPNNGSSGKVTQQGKEVGDYTIDANGKVTITLNKDYKTNVAFEGTLSFEGTVRNTGDNTGSKITFGTKDEVIVKPKNDDTDLAITKQGGYLQSSGEYAGYYKYTIVVTTTKGTSSDIILTDKFTGVNSFTADQMKGWTVKYNPAGGSTSPDSTTGPNGEDLTQLTPVYSNTGDNKGWSVTLPQVTTNPSPWYGSYTVTYYVKPDATTAADGKKEVTNTAQAHDDYHWPSASVTTPISSSLIKKSSNIDYNNKRINWTINVHQPAHSPQNLAGEKFKDIVTVDGEKIDTSNIYVLDANGNKVPSSMYFKDKSGNYLKDSNGNKIIVNVAEDGSFTFPAGSYWDTDYYFEYSTDFPEGAKGTRCYCSGFLTPCCSLSMSLD